MSLATLQQRLVAARAGRARRVIADCAMTVPGAPDSLSENRLRLLETATQTPPNNGEELRAFAAALNISMLDVLRDLGYWPPLVAGEDSRRIAMSLLDEAARIGGWRLTRAGQKIVVELG